MFLTNNRKYSYRTISKRQSSRQVLEYISNPEQPLMDKSLFPSLKYYNAYLRAISAAKSLIEAFKKGEKVNVNPYSPYKLEIRIALTKHLNNQLQIFTP